MKQPKFTAYKNTDSVDIEAKCLGISIKDLSKKVSDKIYNNRGLHIQIKHNGDKRTFELASKLVDSICYDINTQLIKENENE